MRDTCAHFVCPLTFACRSCLGRIMVYCMENGLAAPDKRLLNVIQASKAKGNDFARLRRALWSPSSVSKEKNKSLVTMTLTKKMFAIDTPCSLQKDKPILRALSVADCVVIFFSVKVSCVDVC